MLRVAIAGLRYHARRTALAGLAIALSVAFFAGTLIYSDSARAAFADDFARAGRGVDVAVDPPTGDGYDAQSSLDAAALARVRAVPGVEHAEGRTVRRLAVLDQGGHALSNAGRTGFAVSLPQDPDLMPFDLIRGRLPHGVGEAVVDLDTATRLALPLDGALSVLDARGEAERLQVVGVVDFGAVRMFQGWSVVGLPDRDLARLTTGSAFASIVVRARAGVSPARLRDDVHAALGDTVRTPIVTGDVLRAELAAASAKYSQAFSDVLLAGCLVAVVVAALVVFNTFRILLAQRTRELALLRTVGASRRQLFGLAALEATAIGALASSGGVALGLGVAKLIFMGRALVGTSEPGHALVVTPAALLAGIAMGTATTVAASVVPAFAASQVSPLSALRTADTTTGRSRRSRTGVIAVLLGLIGGGLIGSGATAGFGGTTRILLGAMIVFVGGVIALPLIVVPLATAVGALPARIFDVTALLALRNAQRNPRRIAATATALMIGATLVSLFAVVFATSSQQTGRELAENFPVDFSVKPVSVAAGPRSLPDDVEARLRARPEFSAVVRSHTDLLWTDDAGGADPISMAALERGQTAFVPEVMAGSLDTMGPGRAAVRRTYADAIGLRVGDQFDAHSFRGQHYQARIVALFDDAPVEGEVLVDWADFLRLSGDYGDQILIRRSAGTSAVAARSALDTVLAAFPLTSVTSQAERGQSLTAALQRRLGQFGILLGVSVAIAIFGIANTLALSVWERTRESATMRVLGMRRRQLRAILIFESVIIAVIGAGLGVAFGVAIGWFTARSLIVVYGHGTPSIPVLALLGFAVAATLAAVLASLLAARRVDRADLVAVLHD